MNTLSGSTAYADQRKESPASGDAWPTAHGLSRIMERTGKNMSRSMDLTRKAWKKGKVSCEFNAQWERQPGRLQANQGGRPTEHRIYKGNLFIFSKDGALITMFPLPEDYYHRKEYYDGKIRVRRAKRYYRMNCLSSFSGGFHSPSRREAMKEGA